MPICIKPSASMRFPLGRNPRQSATKSQTASGPDCHWVSRSGSTVTRLISSRLSQTMKLHRSVCPADAPGPTTVYTGMPHCCSHPGHTTLVAGRDRRRSRWDFRAATASAGQPASSRALIRIVWSREPATRSSTSIRTASGLIVRGLMPEPPRTVPSVQCRRLPASPAASGPARRI